MSTKSRSDQVKEMVDHPSHYNSHPAGIECIDVVEHMSFNIGNAVKYLWREGLKGNSIEDLKKARWYIDREIEKRGRFPIDRQVQSELDDDIPY